VSDSSPDRAPGSPEGTRPSGIPKGFQIAAGAAFVALLLGWYGWTQLGAASSYQYFQTLEELHVQLAERGAPPPGGRSLRVHGYVAEGSIVRDVDGRQVHFAVQNDPPHGGGPPGRTLRVRYLSLETPDLFKDGAEVVVEGRLASRGAERVGTDPAGAAGEWVLVADNVLAKCPSKFEARTESVDATGAAEAGTRG